MLLPLARLSRKVSDTLRRMNSTSRWCAPTEEMPPLPSRKANADYTRVRRGSKGTVQWRATIDAPNPARLLRLQRASFGTRGCAALGVWFGVSRGECLRFPRRRVQSLQFIGRVRIVSELLVSVRDVEEARLVLDRAVPFLDVKEPSAGSLGRAPDSTVAEVARLASERPRVTVTAALGELEEADPRAWHATDYVRLYKLGLASAAATDWRKSLRTWKRRIENEADASLVAVAYADHHLAQAPTPEDVLNIALADGFPYYLVDTFAKTEGNLFNWLSPEQLSQLITRARSGGVRVAIAGSLDLSDVGRVVDAGADVVAVRGAACVDRQRSGGIDPERLSALLKVVASASGAAVTSHSVED